MTFSINNLQSLLSVDNISTLDQSNLLSRESTRELLPYAAASCTSFGNDESWIRPLKYNLLSPQNIRFPALSSQIHAHLKCYFDENTGLKISIIEGTKEVIIAFGAQGSGKSELDDSRAYACFELQGRTAKRNMGGFSCSIYEEAAQFVNDFSRSNEFRNKKIVLVGQSFGGSLAQYTGLSSQFTAYCFNPVPLGRAQIQKLGADKTRRDRNVCVVSTEGDMVTLIAENRISSLARWVIQAPELFGRKFIIPSAYSDPVQNHSYFMGSFLKYLGYDDRTKIDSIPVDELWPGQRDEEFLSYLIQEMQKNAQALTELKRSLLGNDTNKATTILQGIKTNNYFLFSYLSYLVWIANEERDFGDSSYGERTLLNMPAVLNKIHVNATPILDGLIEHFNALLFIQNAKKIFLEFNEEIKKSLIEETKFATQELFDMPFFSSLQTMLERQLRTAVQSVKNDVHEPKSLEKGFDENAMRLVLTLKDSLERNEPIETQRAIIGQISTAYPDLLLSILLLLEKRLNFHLDFIGARLLLSKKPSLLVELFEGNKNILFSVIECMGSLQKMQHAIDALSQLKRIFHCYFSQLPDSERQEKKKSIPKEFGDIIKQIEELGSYFCFSNMQNRQTEKFRQNFEGRIISSQEAISPNRLIERVSEVSNAPLKRVYMVGAECTGVIKVGGLAEAIRGIAEGLISRGHQVTLIMPKYDVFPNDRSGKVTQALQPTPYEITHAFGDVAKTDRIFHSKIGAIDALFIEDSEDPSTEGRFSLTGNSLYEIPGDKDAAKMKERFAYFGQAAAELIKELKQQIDVVFFHDWHGALGIPLLAYNNTKEWMEGTIPPLVYVFHNNGYSAQGELEEHKHASILKSIKLAPRYFNTAKESISIADHVCTVSESYAQEVQAREGNGLQMQMRDSAHRGKLTGITNGCNLNLWDPKTEKQLTDWIDPVTKEKTPIHFGVASDLLENKKLIKQQLQSWLVTYHPNTVAKYGIDVRKDTLISFVGRFDASQKGLDKLGLAMRVAAEKGACLIVMGCKENGPEAVQILDDLEKKAQNLKNPSRWGGAWIIRDSDRLDFQNGTEDGVPGIGHLVRAASNLNFCPSEYEPCGLTHLEGFPYGQMTVAPRLGGFSDIICQNPEDPLFNGFLFPRLDDWRSQQQEQAVTQTLSSAIDYWNQLSNPEKNARIQNLIETSKRYNWTTSPQGLSPIEKYEIVMDAAKGASQTRGASEAIHPVLLSMQSIDRSSRPGSFRTK
jgi:starch synthase